MIGKLLDTNAVIALQRSDKAFLEFLSRNPNILIPAIVIGELYFGAFNSGKPEFNIAVIDAFVAKNTILHADEMTGKYYAKIRHSLKQKGHPIPENDLWIAATAMQYNLALVTRDKHFTMVDSLKIETW
jgi:tRNA(fMet)-specific endonuclease VapC